MGVESLSKHFHEIINLRDHIIGSQATEDCAADIKELEKILASAENSQNFDKAITEIGERLSQVITEDSLIDLEQSWPFLSLYLKEKELQKIVDSQADIQSRICGLNVPGAKVKFSKSLNCVASTTFDYTKVTNDNDAIYLNTKKAYLLTDFLSAVEACTHEQHHQLHNALARAVKHGSIQPHHPLYEDGRYFKKMWDNKALVGFKPCYDAHLDERNSQAFGRTIRKNLELSLRLLDSDLDGQTPSPVPKA